jgi:hypothetical protein
MQSNTPIVGHKIFFPPAPVRVSTLSGRCSTLSRGCAASGAEPDQGLSSQKDPLWFPVGASLWAPKLGYSCQLCFNYVSAKPAAFHPFNLPVT